MDLKPVRWILASLSLVTLYFQTNLADPFNSPKLWILMFFAAWLCGYLFAFKNLIIMVIPIKNLFYLLIFFLASLIMATILTDFKYVAIFGDTQRRNGFLQYFSLSIILLASTLFLRIFNINKLFRITYFIALLSCLYSFLQTTGNDFVMWNNPYNSIISTLGNPNFAAAVMAIMGVLVFSSIYISSFTKNQRFFGGVLAFLLLIAIYRTNAKQGLLSYVLGVGIFLIFWIFERNRKFGIFASFIGISIFTFSVLGMLQIGPMEKFLYKPSVSIRGYYWRAGFEMFKDNPVFGVGIDRYGAYFKEYREVNYPLNYGFDITSSNAHNTFIQFFATGGLFVGIAYLILNLYIFRRAIYGIKTLTGNNRLFLLGLFSSWIAYHAQSLVSIDNIGISIWGWILGGSIVGISVSSNSQKNDDQIFFQRKPGVINLNQPLTSSILTLLAITSIAPLYRGESNSFKSSVTVNFQEQTALEYYKNLQVKVIDSPLNDPSYKLLAASRLIIGGFAEIGIKEAKKILEENPRNLDSLILLATTYEQLNQWQTAISYRERIVELDPWNAANYLAIGKDYKSLGDLEKSRKMLNKILSFASTSSIGIQAKKDLTN